jgi:trans-aconitate methyltransferase
MQSQWRVKLEPILVTPIPPPETYWRWLSRHASNIDRWETVYLQVLDGKDPVVNCMRGTALRSFLSALPEKKSAKFIDAFVKRMVAAYPPQPNGQTLSPSSASFCSHSVSQVKIFHSSSTACPVHWNPICGMLKRRGFVRRASFPAA